jgi:hypothetical protein
MEPRERRTQQTQQRSREEATTGMAAPAGAGAGPLTPESGHFVLAELERSGSLPPGVRPSQAFTCTVTALLRRLPSDQASEFVQRHLPRALQSLIDTEALSGDQEREQPETPEPDDDVAGYLAEVASELQVDATQAEETARAAIASLRLLMSGEEVDAVAAELPPGLETLWREASDVPGAPGHSGLP